MIKSTLRGSKDTNKKVVKQQQSEIVNEERHVLLGKKANKVWQKIETKDECAHTAKLDLVKSLKAPKSIHLMTFVTE